MAYVIVQKGPIRMFRASNFTRSSKQIKLISLLRKNI